MNIYIRYIKYTKKFIKFVLRGLGVALIIAIIGIILLFNSAYTPPELINETTSPNGTYTLKAYLSSEGAISAWTLYIDLHFNKSWKKKKQIYYAYGDQDYAYIEWIDDNTCIINSITLNLPNDEYHTFW